MFKCIIYILYFIYLVCLHSKSIQVPNYIYTIKSNVNTQFQIKLIKTQTVVYFTTSWQPNISCYCFCYRYFHIRLRAIKANQIKRY